jgi:hypothetical protein
VDVQIHIFLTSTLVGEWSASCTGRFIPGERVPCTHWIGGWVDPQSRSGRLGEKKFLTLRGLELRPFDPPLPGQSLYRIRSPGS